ncbi:hypothetical protein BT63DRAFT_464489 [Microthyrium microscopicum]|uniref:Uncharacterized protein n=1 Tax=Microthyrium microscopicum TaxID=703497 RepID=A0A6A6TYS2_9PEZI|nr:hypothetical protein BT63DRAFT_464489 [Microthyrium microscopicum]
MLENTTTWTFADLSESPPPYDPVHGTGPDSQELLSGFGAGQERETDPRARLDTHEPAGTMGDPFTLSSASDASELEDGTSGEVILAYEGEQFSESDDAQSSLSEIEGDELDDSDGDFFEEDGTYVRTKNGRNASWQCAYADQIHQSLTFLDVKATAVFEDIIQRYQADTKPSDYYLADWEIKDIEPWNEHDKHTRYAMIEDKNGPYYLFSEEEEEGDFFFNPHNGFVYRLRAFEDGQIWVKLLRDKTNQLRNEAIQHSGSRILERLDIIELPLAQASPPTVGGNTEKLERVEDQPLRIADLKQQVKQREIELEETKRNLEECKQELEYSLEYSEDLTRQMEDLVDQLS